jgi:hypothetical protein
MGSDREVTIEVVLRPSDVYTPFLWTAQNLLRWVLLIVACLILFNLYSSIFGGHGAEPVLAWFWACILILCLSAAMFLLPYWRVLRMFRKAPAFSKSRRWSISAQGLHLESEDTRADYKWSLFARIIETRTTFLLLQTSYYATYIPKRCFSSPGDIQTVRNLIRENFTGKYRIRRD